MKATWETELLRDLHEGRASRNRNFEDFRKPSLHRVWKGYRRLRSLAAELTRRDVRVRIAREEDSRECDVEIVLEAFHYSRRVRLTGWEFDFLRVELGADRLSTSPP